MECNDLALATPPPASKKSEDDNEIPSSVRRKLTPKRIRRKKHRFLQKKNDTEVEEPAKKKKRRTDADTWKPEYMELRGKRTFTSDEEFKEAIDAIEIQHCQRDIQGINDLTLIKREFKQAGERARKGDKPKPRRERAVYECAFRDECGCPWKCEANRLYKMTATGEAVHDADTGEDAIDHYYIRESIDPHADHGRVSRRKTGIPLAYRQYLTSLDQYPDDVINACDRAGLLFVGDDEAKLRRWVTDQKKKFSQSSMPTGTTQGSWDRIRELAKLNTSKSKSEKPKFNDHTAFIVGEYEIKSKSKEKRVVIVVSSENLLLNGHRQRCYGQDLAFNIDASYKYTIAQHYGLIAIYVVSPDQVGHVVCYALMNKEDHSAIEFILQQVKTDIERIVKERVGRGETVV
jgi:hypothetical protein